MWHTVHLVKMLLLALSETGSYLYVCYTVLKFFSQYLTLFFALAKFSNYSWLIYEKAGGGREGACLFILPASSLLGKQASTCKLYKQV